MEAAPEGWAERLFGVVAATQPPGISRKIGSERKIRYTCRHIFRALMPAKAEYSRFLRRDQNWRKPDADERACR
jgi:hypothetical protein